MITMSNTIINQVVIDRRVESKYNEVDVVRIPMNYEPIPTLSYDEDRKVSFRGGILAEELDKLGIKYQIMKQYSPGMQKSQGLREKSLSERIAKDNSQPKHAKHNVNFAKFYRDKPYKK